MIYPINQLRGDAEKMAQLCKSEHIGAVVVLDHYVLETASMGFAHLANFPLQSEIQPTDTLPDCFKIHNPIPIIRPKYERRHWLLKEIKEQKLMEVLSRVERIRARVRFAKTKAKRERKAQIALKMRSSNATANKRARRLAIKLMKKRLLRGRDINKISFGEKERIERVIQKRKAVIGRVAMKLVPRIRQVEKSRLSHSKFTKGGPNVVF